MKRKLFFVCLLVVSLFTGNLMHANAKSSQRVKENFANVVLFAYFSDDSAGKDYFTNNRTTIMNYYDGSSQRSVKNYLNAVSYGQFEVHNIFPQDNGTSIDAYEIKGVTTAQASSSNVDGKVIEEVLAGVPEIQNEVVDYNGDGCIDNLTIILHGGLTANTSTNPTLYPHQDELKDYYTWSGKQVYNYNMLNTVRFTESMGDGSGLLIHELMHSLGYPDLYDSTGVSTPVGRWDIMSASSKRVSYPLAYLRMHFSKWIDIDTMTSSASGLRVDIQSNPDGNQAYILKSPYNEYELFVVEMRKKGSISGTDSYDATIGGNGIIVYRVNTLVEGLSNDEGQTGVYVFRPQGDDSKIQDAYLSKESGRTSIGSSDLSQGLTDGALTFSDGSNSGIVISNVSSSAGDSMTFDVTIPTASNTEVWENTAYPSQNATSAGMVSLNDKEYVASLENDSIHMYVYDGGSWTPYGTALQVDSNVVQIKLYEDNGNIYISYISNSSTGSQLTIKVLDNGTWKDYATIQQVQSYGYDVEFLNKTMYVAYTDENSQAHLVSVTDQRINDLGAYASQTTGTANIAILNGDIYVSTTASSGTSKKVIIAKYDGQQLTTVKDDLLCETYDMASDGSRLYVSLSTSTSMQMATYDGMTWSVGQSQSISGWYPKLYFEQGNVYMLLKPRSTNSKLRLYQYLQDNFQQEGIDIDIVDTSIIDEPKLIYSSGELYVKYVSNNQVKVKKKTMSDSLLSIQVTPPTKVIYNQGEQVDLTGLEVYARTKDSYNRI